MAIFTGMFYPRITYGLTPTILDIGGAALHDGPARDVAVEEVAIRGDNISTSGFRESLHTRTETVLTLVLWGLTAAKAAEVRTFVNGHALLGKQAAIVLDRLATCAGQFEFDTYNAFFTKAELLELRWGAKRMVMGRALYSVQLSFRQGQ